MKVLIRDTMNIKILLKTNNIVIYIWKPLYYVYLKSVCCKDL